MCSQRLFSLSLSLSLVLRFSFRFLICSSTGTYADNEAAGASATGYGESILKILLTKTVVDEAARSNASIAAEKGIRLLQERVQGLGGIIVIDRHGNVRLMFSTLTFSSLSHSH